MWTLSWLLSITTEKGVKGEKDCKETNAIRVFVLRFGETHPIAVPALSLGTIPEFSFVFSALMLLTHLPVSISQAWIKHSAIPSTLFWHGLFSYIQLTFTPGAFWLYQTALNESHTTADIDDFTALPQCCFQAAYCPETIRPVVCCQISSVSLDVSDTVSIMLMLFYCKLNLDNLTVSLLDRLSLYTAFGFLLHDLFR